MAFNSRNIQNWNKAEHVFEAQAFMYVLSKFQRNALKSIGEQLI